MRRRKKHVPHASHDRWLVSYADFITLLFAFFVVMYSTAQVDNKKVVRLAAAIQVAFQQLGADPATTSPAPVREFVDISNATPSVALARSAESPDLAALRKELEQTLAPEISRGEVALQTGRDGLIISLREAGFFDSGSADIKAASQSAFTRMAMLLRAGQYSVRIEGHTDNVRIHNTQYDSNWELSTARSTDMVRLLIVKYGFVPQRLSASGYGEYHPIASNATVAGRALNRRVDLVVVGKQETQPRVSDLPTIGSKE
jgi:chemotaxis protein MotB